MSNVKELLSRPITTELYDEIRDLWKRHSIAEASRDIPGLLYTLTEDCVYELPQIGEVWRGHAGATRFYTDLLAAFPDIHFDLERIVIGPQGVFETADVTGTQEGPWLRWPASGQAIRFKVLILFPWDPAARRFSGEVVWIDPLDALPA